MTTTENQPAATQAPAAAPAARRRVWFGFREAFIACAAVGLAAVWLHRYPAGIDIPQHANLFRIWASMSDARSGDAFFYEVLLFTPYLLTYLVALPLTKIGGALFAVKALMTVAVIATPWQLARWLKAVGADVWWSLWGFVLALGFGYHWGFISWVVSFPLAFAYLAALEAQHREPSRAHVGAAAALIVTLFFCHAMTFAVCAAVGGLYGLLEARRPRRAALELGHLAPAAVLTLLWVTGEKRPPLPHPKGWPPEVGRIASLFGGAFSAHASYFWAIAGLGVLAVLTLLARPALAREPRRWIPLALSAIAFGVLPETIRGTWLIGTRFCAFVQAFAPAAFVPTAIGPAATRRVRAATVALVIAALVALNVRLAEFNRELAGLDDVIAAVEPGADVQGMVPEMGGDSEALGEWQLNQVMAWLTAERGGFLENDSGRYFQIPVQRRIDIAWPSHYRYYLGHGDGGRGFALASMHAGRDAAVRLVGQSGAWALYEAARPTKRTGDVTVVRYGQDWGDLGVDHAVSGGALTVAGRAFAHGLGTHSRSAIQIRLDHAGAALSGSVGLDDGAGGQGHAVFKILGKRRRLLWESGEMKTGDAARPFSVTIADPDADLLLVTEPIGANAYGHTDWLDLQIGR